MNETDRIIAVQNYLDEVSEQFYSGHAIEHAYRPALKTLMSVFDDTVAINDPKHSEHGAPDFIFIKKSNQKIIQGYAEAKDITVNLDKTEKTNQMERYGGYANLYLTDYLEFRFFKNGDKYQTISLGHVKDGVLYKTPENSNRLVRELEAFLDQAPEKIKSGKRLAQIMGGKARRIRDNVTIYLKDTDEHNAELTKIYDMMKKMLVHDLSEEKFADMYAQTLVYGLFVARYGDKTPDTFSRSEARDLVPKSNPFLRHFFDHIVGPDFDARLGYIVDELCEIFLVSDVSEIVHKHLKIADDTVDVKDPIIHFYEDFLQEYDPAERKSMGAYYTPIPVVKFIVQQVDKILKEDFGIAKGLASDETFTTKVDQGHVAQVRNKKTGRLEKTSLVDKTFHRVQVLDPAVGTATFLNETIKHIHKSFIGQEGRWESYVNDNLVKRLYGFELMMAPYTIAHLKLGMTLQETGVSKLNERLGVYLTNTLEEGIPQQSSLFDFGLAGAVSEESRLAADVKSEMPVMIVMGNPPYSVSSNNKSKFIENLVADYKKDLNERNIQPLSDDYIKFIRFAEDMIAKNGSGIIAMITNNSFIDGTIHKSMRNHLMETFDDIYILDLNGSVKKNSSLTNNIKDENVFDIQQGVSINIFVKKSITQSTTVVKHAELIGDRKSKFDSLIKSHIDWQQIVPTGTANFFKPFNYQKFNEYNKFISLGKLFIVHNAGTATGRDNGLVHFTSDELIATLDENKDIYNDQEITSYLYRPFDLRYTVYNEVLIQRLRKNVMKHVYKHEDNFSLLATQKNRQVSTLYVSITDKIVDRHELDSAADSMHVFPMYLYDENGIRSSNFDPTELSALVREVTVEPTHADIFDYIYATLHSPSYGKEYKEFLKMDFPRIPPPSSDSEFKKLAELGRELRTLHLMQTTTIDSYESTFSERGSDCIESIRYADERVWINDMQYFGNVPEAAWNFYIGGYQPAQKWLKDRKNRKLSNRDLDHYQKIIKVILETDRIMKEIG